LKNQELLKELKSFPKEFQPDDMRQKKTFNNIMNFYDEYEKKHRKSFSFQRWQAAAAGIAAIILASFLFLPNMLNHESKSHEANSPEEKTNMMKMQTDAQKNLVVSPTEQFHPKELEEVKAISIHNSEGIEVKKVTDRSQINLILQVFKQAKFVEKQNKAKEDATSNKKYSFDIVLNNNELLPVEYWPDEQGANLIDGQQRSWWRVERLNTVLDKVLLDSTNGEQQAIRNLNSLHPDVHWDKEYTFSQIGEGPDLKLLATGITSSKELLQIELDPVTGKVLKEEKTKTAEAVKTVQTFFSFIGTGNYQMAWDLIHPRSKEPNPGTKEEQTKNSFNAFYKTHQANLKKINSTDWDPGVKLSDCMCVFNRMVLIKATLTDGTYTEFHAIKDDDNQWKLFWSAAENKLK
jgi:hypothetical protein